MTVKLPNGVGAVNGCVRRVDEHLLPRLPSTIWLGQGKGESNWVWRNGKLVDLNHEHSSGNAQDFIISKRVGVLPTPQERDNALKLVRWFQVNARHINLRWIIFDIYNEGAARSWNPDRGTWKWLYGGGVSEAHRDHVHAYFGGGDQALHMIDDSPLGSGKEIEEMTAQELHNELNNNPMLSLMASRLGMLANLLEKQNELLEQLAAKN
uniref:ARB-07466-like C-terminal domain-containing protein n=1 Tax=Podoviridae sp. ctrfz10 TaxID=2827749 RepID=A0A8S5TAC1_9CAUD|nr:MAG TPA: hypothetical protein [Podoviridae sp. ctrfz10]